MKTYVVKTQDLVNEHLLHHSLTAEYTTDNYADAKRVFDKECEQLRVEDRRSEITDPHFDFPTHEPSRAVWCEICVLEDDELEMICSSEYFYIY